MPFLIDELDRPPATLTVFLGGKQVQVRAVRAAETDALKRVLPKPGPELVPNPILGREPALVADEHSPRYLAAVEAWMAKIQTAAVAIAADIAVGGRAYSVGMSDADLLAYINAVVPVMRGKLSDPEIIDTYRHVGSISDAMTGVNGEDRIEAAKKNLSGLPRPVLLALVEELCPRPTASLSAT